jgi:hypothetical protein
MKCQAKSAWSGLFEPKNLATERRIIKVLGPFPIVVFDPETMTGLVQFVEVDPARLAEAHEFNRRLSMLRDHNALAALGSDDKFGKAGLCLP